ncbi:MAG: ATP-binding protein [Sulfurimonas sp.]|jgi:flavorubredoxin|nr:ATP-binding protein [Sulfurimonadaceae bacterium]
MSKVFDTTKAYEIAKDIYWIGMHLKGDPFQCHPYLIKNGDESILLDPGSMLEFDEVVRKIDLVVGIKSIKYIVLHHQDPDLCASVPEIEKLIDREDLQIITHSRMSLLIKHYMVSSSYYEIDKEDFVLKTKNGKTLEFYTTPYCHSPGAFVSYEPRTKTLFSGDIFGGIEHSWHFYADETYFSKARLFHEEYMPSKDIFNYSLAKIEKLDIDLIAPQHGSIIEKRYIPKLIEDMRGLDCGLYIDKKYNEELQDTIAKLKESQKTIKEQSIMMAQQAKKAEIGEMVQNIAHQWRQPLAILNTTLAILKQMSQSGEIPIEFLKDKFDKMQLKIDYMSQSVEDFLDFNAPQKQKESFLVYDAIKSALAIVGLDSMTSIEPDERDIVFFGLKNELVQVLVSVLSNINDIRTTRDIKEPKVLIKYKKINDKLELSIEDSCGGIKDEDITKIFDPYFSTKHKAMGVGLGLYIAKNIVEHSMQGSIEVQNILKDEIMGARFIIKI